MSDITRKNSRVIEPAQHQVQDAVIFDDPWPLDSMPEDQKSGQDDGAFGNHLPDSSITIHGNEPNILAGPSFDSLNDPLAPAPIHPPLSPLPPPGVPDFTVNTAIPVTASVSAPPTTTATDDNDIPVQDLLRFPRTHSMPPPSQLGDLQHPHQRSIPFSTTLSASTSSPHYLPNDHPSHDHHEQNPPSHPPHHQTEEYRELSLQLADAVQTAVQTMLQISPPQVLDSTKEQIAACSLAVPTPSMSALFTAMKNLNFISANMEVLFGSEKGELARQQQQQRHPKDSSSSSGLSSAAKGARGLIANTLNDFYVGEMLQNLGDLMSGMAAQAGVDLVLYNASMDLKPRCVRGNESAIQYLLTHVLRQILATANRNDSIEIGLYLQPHLKSKAKTQTEKRSNVTPDGPGHVASNLSSSATPSAETANGSHATAIPEDYQGPLRCMYRISHVFSRASDSSRSGSPSLSSDSSSTSQNNHDNESKDDLGPDSEGTKENQKRRLRQRRKNPALSTFALKRLLELNEATLVRCSGEEGAGACTTVDDDTNGDGRAWELALVLDLMTSSSSLVLEGSDNESESGSESARRQRKGQDDEEERDVQSSLDHQQQQQRERFGEPSMEQLSSFMDVLKGMRVTFYADADVCFAERVKKCLIGWGMNVNVRPPSDDLEAEPPPVMMKNLASNSGNSTPGGSVSGAAGAAAVPTSTAASSGSAGLAQQTNQQGAAQNSSQQQQTPAQFPASTTSFVFIDDDVDVLKAILQIQRNEIPANLRKRPSMAAHHRPKSYPSQPVPAGVGTSGAGSGIGSNTSTPGSGQAVNGTPNGPVQPQPQLPPSSSSASSSNATTTTSSTSTPTPPPHPLPIIIHFTSLENYKATKDLVVQYIPTLFSGTKVLPEVMVIPKPIGLRRLMTTLHTSIMRPRLDPLFMPTATAPFIVQEVGGQHGSAYGSSGGHGYGHGHSHSHGHGHGGLQDLTSPKSPTGMGRMTRPQSRVGSENKLMGGVAGSMQQQQSGSMIGGISGNAGGVSIPESNQLGGGGPTTPSGSTGGGGGGGSSSMRDGVMGTMTSASTPLDGSINGSSSTPSNVVTMAGRGLLVNLSSATNNALELYQQLQEMREKHRLENLEGMLNRNQKGIVLPSAVGIVIPSSTAGSDPDGNGNAGLGFEGGDGYFGSIAMASSESRVGDADRGEEDAGVIESSVTTTPSAPSLLDDGTTISTSPGPIASGSGQSMVIGNLNIAPSIESLLLETDWTTPPADMKQLMLGNSAAAGAILQNANGEHVGIYFQPKYRKIVPSFEERKRKEKLERERERERLAMLQQQGVEQQVERSKVFQSPSFASRTPELPPGVVAVPFKKRRGDLNHQPLQQQQVESSEDEDEGGAAPGASGSGKLRTARARAGILSIPSGGGAAGAASRWRSRRGRSAAAGYGSGDSDAGLSSASPTPKVPNAPIPNALMQSLEAVKGEGSKVSTTSSTTATTSPDSKSPLKIGLPPRFGAVASSSSATSLMIPKTTQVSGPISSILNSAIGLQTVPPTPITEPAPTIGPALETPGPSTSTTTTKVQETSQPVQVRTQVPSTGAAATTSTAGVAVVPKPLTGAAAVAAALANKSKQNTEPPKIVPAVRVLIVDDNPINQNILSAFMKRKKIKYDVASNGLQAVEKWKGGGFHLILMDIQMPIMDGIDATKEIRRLERIDPLAGLPSTAPARIAAAALAEQYKLLQQEEQLQEEQLQEEQLQEEHASGARADNTRKTPEGLPQADGDNKENKSDDVSGGSQGKNNAGAKAKASASAVEGLFPPLPVYRSSVIIVALTASSLQSDRVAALAAGCNDFLTKPVSLLWLNNKIIEWGSIKALQMWGEHRQVARILAQVQARNLMLAQQRQERQLRGLIASGSSNARDQPRERRRGEGQTDAGGSGAGPSPSVVAEEDIQQQRVPTKAISAAAANALHTAAAVRKEELRKQQESGYHHGHRQQHRQHHHHNLGTRSHVYGSNEPGLSSERFPESSQAVDSSSTSQGDMHGAENEGRNAKHRQLRRESMARARQHRKKKEERERDKNRDKDDEAEERSQPTGQTGNAGDEPDVHVGGDRHVEAEAEAESSRQVRRRDPERERRRQEKRRQKELAKAQAQGSETLPVEGEASQMQRDGITGCRRKKRRSKGKEKAREKGERKERRKDKGKGRMRDHVTDSTAATTWTTTTAVVLGTSNVEPDPTPGLSAPSTPLRVKFAREVTMRDTYSREIKVPVAAPASGADLHMNPRSGQGSVLSLLPTGDSSGDGSNQNHWPSSREEDKAVRIDTEDGITLRDRDSHEAGDHENGVAGPNSSVELGNGVGHTEEDGVKKVEDEEEHVEEKEADSTDVGAREHAEDQQDSNVEGHYHNGDVRHEDNAIVDRGRYPLH